MVRGMRTPEDAPTDPDTLLRYATVASVDLGAARCTVLLDDDVESPALPWLAPRMGETRVWLPPSVGEQVMLFCPGGEIGAGIVAGGVVSDANSAPSDEAVPQIHFKDGAIFSYDPETSELLIQLPPGGSTVLVSDTVDIVGDVNVTGKVTAGEDVIADTVSLKSHKHTGVAAGTAQSGAPLP